MGWMDGANPTRIDRKLATASFFFLPDIGQANFAAPIYGAVVCSLAPSNLICKSVQLLEERKAVERAANW